MYRPWTTRHMGVEMEVTRTKVGGAYVNANLLADIVGRALYSHTGQRLGGRVGEYFHSSGRTWDVKSDSSCGFEIATPAIRFNEQGHNLPLQSVCRELEGESIQVNQSCGLHVHLSVTDYQWSDLQRLIRFWVRYEPFFMELIPPRRRGNTYCLPLRGSHRWEAPVPQHLRDALNTSSRVTFERHIRGTMERYSALNITPWWQSQRIEFRLHSGTINYDKIRAWSMLMGAVVQRVIEPTMPEIEIINQTPTTMLSTSYVLRQLGLLPSSIRKDVPQESVELAAWVNARRLQFSGQPAAPRPRRAQAAPQRYAGTRLQFNTGRTGCQAGTPVPCPTACEPGFRLCPTHRSDYFDDRDYLVINETVNT